VIILLCSEGRTKMLPRGELILKPALPPRSPDLTPVDFFLWNQFKDYIYREPVDTLEELQNRLQESIATLTPEMLRNVQNNLLRRAALCIEVGGREFEHLM
jgi:hypothetical protein